MDERERREKNRMLSMLFFLSLPFGQSTRRQASGADVFSSNQMSIEAFRMHSKPTERMRTMHVLIIESRGFSSTKLNSLASRERQKVDYGYASR